MLWCAGALALAIGAGGGACACNGSGNGKGTTGKGNGDGNVKKPPVSAVCDKQRDKVEKLYRGAITETDPKKRAAAEAAVPDNVQMIMNDCRTDPKRFGPCLERVTTVADMEKSCIIPLDDEGRVEGKMFGGQ
jgi:hypothetical protein